MSDLKDHEAKICNIVKKITKGLGGYFLKNVDSRCAKLKTVDPNWFDTVVQDLVSEFQTKSLEGSIAVLRQYDVNAKGAELDEANRKLRHSRTWRPTGDPEKDIRAHVWSLDKSYAEKLTHQSKQLNEELRREVNDLKSLRRKLHDELMEFRSLCDKLQELSKSVENTAPCANLCHESRS